MGLDVTDFGNDINGTPCIPDSMNTDANFTPNGRDIFPEYLTDLGVLQCPSDPDTDLRIIPQGCQPAGGPSYAGLPTNGDESYLYLGWIFDQANGDDPTQAAPNLGNGAYSIPTQLLLAFIKFSPTALGLGGSDSLIIGGPPADPTTAVNALDQPINVGAPFGTSGGDQIQRLKEGIERFLITNINNPAGSAKAQTEIPVMWDIVNIDPNGSGEFNHVPGGSNVLYMDGHVKFEKYTPDGKFPVNQYFANAVKWMAG